MIWQLLYESVLGNILELRTEIYRTVILPELCKIHWPFRTTTRKTIVSLTYTSPPSKRLVVFCFVFKQSLETKVERTYSSEAGRVRVPRGQLVRQFGSGHRQTEGKKRGSMLERMFKPEIWSQYWRALQISPASVTAFIGGILESSSTLLISNWERK